MKKQKTQKSKTKSLLPVGILSGCALCNNRKPTPPARQIHASKLRTAFTNPNLSGDQYLIAWESKQYINNNLTDSGGNEIGDQLREEGYVYQQNPTSGEGNVNGIDFLAKSYDNSGTTTSTASLNWVGANAIGTFSDVANATIDYTGIIRVVSLNKTDGSPSNIPKLYYNVLETVQQAEWPGVDTSK